MSFPLDIPRLPPQHVRMTEVAKQEVLRDELVKLIDRIAFEFDLSDVSILGAIEITKAEFILSMDRNNRSPDNNEP